MKVKKILPQLITAGLSVIMLIYTLISAKISVNTFPFKLFEKLGIYYGDTGYGIMNSNISMNGSYEGFVSLLKKFAVNDVIHNLIPFAVFSVLLVTALIMVSKTASKSEYKWTVYLCAVLLPIVFCDFTNLVFFKTLYANSLILIFLLLICGILLMMYNKNSAGITGIISVSVIAVIYSLLGTVQAITAIVLGIIIARLSRISNNKVSKILSVVLGIVIIIQSISFAFSYKAFDYRQNLYNAIFYGVCKYDSVTELGLDEKLDDFKEVYYGMMENEADYDLENTFYNKMSYTKLIKYYITHPSNAIKIIDNQAKSAFYNDYDFGFTPYNSAKKLYVPLNFIIALVFTVIYIVISTIVGKKYSNIKPVTEFMSGIAIMWFVSLVATAIYCGNCDITQNMYTFNILFDIMLVSGLIGGIRVILHRQDEKKEEFGITHE